MQRRAARADRRRQDLQWGLVLADEDALLAVVDDAGRLSLLQWGLVLADEDAPLATFHAGTSGSTFNGASSSRTRMLTHEGRA